MAVLLFRVFIAPGKTSLSDLEARIDDWVASNDPWAFDSVAHTLSPRQTALDGSGETYYSIDVRFLQGNTKTNLAQKLGDKLKNKVAWYRYGYHRCTHDEGDPTPCSWDDTADWTAKDATIPDGVPTFDTGN